MPKRTFMPSVNMNVVARERARPIQAVFQAHSLVLIRLDVEGRVGREEEEVELGLVSTSAATAVRMPGAISAIITRRYGGIFGFET